MKKLLYEIIGIVILAGLLGIIYNYSLKENKRLDILDPMKSKIKLVDTNSTEVDNPGNGEDEGGLRTLTYEMVVEKLKAPDVFVIDARTPSAYEQGYIGNAINIYPHMDQDELYELLSEVPYDKYIIVYCDGRKLRPEP